MKRAELRVSHCIADIEKYSLLISEYVHDYFNIKEDLVWIATQEHVPNLLNKIPYLKEIEKIYLSQKPPAMVI